MAAQNGYTSQHAWELYDTTGSTEDWSYNATGGFGYTFEIGPDEFHPPFPEVIDEYLGAGQYAGKGNREAYLIALENAVNPTTHSVLTGKAPAGATLRLRKTFASPTWESSIQDTLDTTMTVGPDGRFTWHVNPSTRPVVMDRQVETVSGEPVAEESWTGTTAPLQSTDQEFVAQDVDLLRSTSTGPPRRPRPRGLSEERRRLAHRGGQFGNAVAEKERVLMQDPAQGTYVLRVLNFASVTPNWTLTAALFNAEASTVPGLVENWTLTCERDGRVDPDRAGGGRPRAAAAGGPQRLRSPPLSSPRCSSRPTGWMRRSGAGACWPPRSAAAREVATSRGRVLVPSNRCRADTCSCTVAIESCSSAATSWSLSPRATAGRPPTGRR